MSPNDISSQVFVFQRLTNLAFSLSTLLSTQDRAIAAFSAALCLQGVQVATIFSQRIIVNIRANLSSLFPEQINIDQLGFTETSMTVDEQYIRSIVMPLSSDTPVITKTLTTRTIW